MIDTTGPRALTTNEKVSNPVWSPDSKRIAYVGESPINSGREEVFSIRADGTDKMQYTVNGGKVRGLTWSPGGLWLVYADDSSGNFDLYAIRSSGIGVVRLTNNPGMDVYPVLPAAHHAESAGRSAPAPIPGPTPVHPCPGTNPGAQDLLLIYTTNPAVFTLQNTSGQAINLEPLSFSGAGLTVPASVWTGLHRVAAECLQAHRLPDDLAVWPCRPARARRMWRRAPGLDHEQRAPFSGRRAASP